MLLFLLACAAPECTQPVAFEEMTVSDPEGVLGPFAVEHILYYIEMFAAWTGREGVCVPEICVRPQTELAEETGRANATGWYQGPNQPIIVAEDDPIMVYHELCHALDWEEGFSAQNPDLFPRDVRGPLRQITENFAYACDHVGQLGIRAGLEDHCRADMSQEVAILLRTEVYPHYFGDPIVGDPIGVRLERHRLPELTGIAGQEWVQGGADVYAVFPKAPHGEVVRVDPMTGIVKNRFLMPTEGHRSAIRRLLASDGAPAFSVDGPAPALYRLSPDGSVTVKLDFPKVSPWNMIVGTVIGNTATVSASFVGMKEPGEQMGAVDLEMGVLAKRRAKNLIGADYLDGGPDGFLGSGWIAEEKNWAHVLQWLDPGTTIVSYELLPGSWNTDHAVPTDGLQKAVILYQLDTGAVGLAVFDRAQGLWRLAADPCGDSAPYSDVSLFSFAGDAWLAEDGPMGSFFTRVVVEE